jgi:exosortase
MKVSDLKSGCETLYGRIGIAGLCALFTLGIAAITWTIHLAPKWLHNPDLSHGLFTPILFVLLLRESRRQGPHYFLPDHPRAVTALLVTILGLSLLVLATGSLYAAATQWSHPLVEFLLGISFTGALVGGALVFASSSIRLLPLNWISAVAISLWVLSLPVPPGTYNDLTLSLQFRVTENVLSALHLLGIPAIRNGNIINLSHSAVGVEEACSGVRSLISCIYAGVFFSAAFVRTWPSRTILIILAPLIAVLMNFVRSLSLTLMANANIDIEGTWHDVTGFAILVTTALLLAGIALLLEKIENRPNAPIKPDPFPARVSPSAATRKLATLLSTACALGLVGIASFQFLTRPVSSVGFEAPELDDWLPSEALGWKMAASQDIYRFSNILETEELIQRSYGRIDESGNLISITMYIAYWKPGQSAVSSVASHTPDACWPGAGWKAEETDTRTAQLPLLDRTTETAEYRVFSYHNTPRHVWYWHSYNRRLIEKLDPRRPMQLIASVLRFGVRSDGEQLFVRFSSNRPWDEIQNEPLISEIFAHLKPYGI